MAGIFSTLDRYNMPGRITRLPRMEQGEKWRPGRGWIELKEETHGGPGLLGAGAKMYHWRLGHGTVPTDDVNGPIPRDS